MSSGEKLSHKEFPVALQEVTKHEKSALLSNSLLDISQPEQQCSEALGTVQAQSLRALRPNYCRPVLRQPFNEYQLALRTKGIYRLHCHSTDLPTLVLQEVVEEREDVSGLEVGYVVVD